MTKERRTLRLPENFLELIAPLCDRERGILITTLCEYAFEDKLEVDENLTTSDLEVYESVFMAVDFEVHDGGI